MREQEVRELYQAYLEVHQPQEEVEQLDEYDTFDAILEKIVVGVSKYLEPDMKKRGENNKKAIEDMKKTKAHKDMVATARKKFDEEVEELDEGRTTNLRALGRESAQRKADRERGRPETESEIHGRLMLGKFRPGASQEERAEGGRQRLKDRGKVPKKGGKDMFEHVLEHLVAEGYADTNESALAIMANMSEEWRESIVEAIQIPRPAPQKYMNMNSGSGSVAPKPDMSTPQDKIEAQRIKNTPLGARLTSPGGPVRNPGPATGPNGFLNRNR
jgi:nucleoid DNA-binding protein